MIALEDGKTMNIAYHTTDPNVGEDRSRMKMYVGYTGLMVTLAFWARVSRKMCCTTNYLQTDCLLIWSTFMKILQPRCCEAAGITSTSIVLLSHWKQVCCLHERLAA